MSSLCSYTAHKMVKHTQTIRRQWVCRNFSALWTHSTVILTILTGKTVFTQFIPRVYWNTTSAASNLFRMFTQSINFCTYISLSQIRENRCLKNLIYKIDRNQWLLLSTFTQGLRQNLRFLNTGKRLFLEISFWSRQHEHRFF